jgi:hypothetical protein
METTEQIQPFRPMGFVIADWDTDEVIDFVACTKQGRMREKVERGLFQRVDLNRFRIDDTHPSA